MVIVFFSFSEINDVTTGMLVEVWSKGVLWDSALGYHYIPLPEVPFSNEVTNNQKSDDANNLVDTNSNTQDVETFDTVQLSQPT